MGRPKKVKEEFDLLDEEWKAAAMSKNDVEIDRLMRDSWAAIHALEAAKKLDGHLAELKEQVKMANEPYAVGKKQNSQKTKFLLTVLKGRGKEVAEPEDFLKE